MIINMFRRLLSDKIVRGRYISAGVEVAEFHKVLNLIFLLEEGQALLNLEKSVDKWVKWEKEQVRRGYEPINLPTFNEHIKDRKLLDEISRQEYKKNEQPTLYAENYKKGITHSTIKWAFVESQI